MCVCVCVGVWVRASVHPSVSYWWQAEETLRVIMERQKKQREDIIFQVQRYKGVCSLSARYQVSPSPPPPSAIEKAKHIGKDCSDTLAQMAGTIRSSELLLADELPTSLGAEVKSSKQVAKVRLCVHDI